MSLPKKLNKMSFSDCFIMYLRYFSTFLCKVNAKLVDMVQIFIWGAHSL